MCQPVIDRFRLAVPIRKLEAELLILLHRPRGIRTCMLDERFCAYSIARAGTDRCGMAAFALPHQDSGNEGMKNIPDSLCATLSNQRQTRRQVCYLRTSLNHAVHWKRSLCPRFWLWSSRGGFRLQSHFVSRKPEGTLESHFESISN